MKYYNIQEYVFSNKSTFTLIFCWFLTGKQTGKYITTFLTFSFSITLYLLLNACVKLMLNNMCSVLPQREDRIKLAANQHNKAL